MTDQQNQAVDAALAGLSASDKFDLIERLVGELRAAFATGGPQPDFNLLEQFVYALRWAVAPDRQPGDDATPMTEDDFFRHLIRTGMMIERPKRPDPNMRWDFEPVELEGEPLSEQIIRERR